MYSSENKFWYFECTKLICAGVSIFMLQNYIIMALKHVHAYLIEVAFDTKCKDQGYQRKTMQSQHVLYTLYNYGSACM